MISRLDKRLPRWIVPVLGVFLVLCLLISVRYVTARTDGQEYICLLTQNAVVLPNGLTSHLVMDVATSTIRRTGASFTFSNAQTPQLTENELIQSNQNTNFAVDKLHLQQISAGSSGYVDVRKSYSNKRAVIFYPIGAKDDPQRRSDLVIYNLETKAYNKFYTLDGQQFEVIEPPNWVRHKDIAFIIVKYKVSGQEAAYMLDADTMKANKVAEGDIARINYARLSNSFSGVQYIAVQWRTGIQEGLRLYKDGNIEIGDFYFSPSDFSSEFKSTYTYSEIGFAAPDFINGRIPSIAVPRYRTGSDSFNNREGAVEIPLDQGGSTELVASGKFEGIFYTLAAWTPDGQRVVYAYNTIGYHQRFPATSRFARAKIVTIDGRLIGDYPLRDTAAGQFFAASPQWTKCK